MAMTYPSMRGVALLCSSLDYGGGEIWFTLAIANLDRTADFVVSFGTNKPHYTISLVDTGGQVYWTADGFAQQNGQPVTEVVVKPRQYAELSIYLKELPIDPGAPKDLILKGVLFSVNLPFTGTLPFKRST